MKYAFYLIFLLIAANEAYEILRSPEDYRIKLKSRGPDLGLTVLTLVFISIVMIVMNPQLADNL